MPYWRECPCCGAHLDPGEQCDCRSGEEAARNYKEKAALGATNTRDGKAERKENSLLSSASHFI